MEIKYQRKPIPGYEDWEIDTNGVVYGVNGNPLSQRNHSRGYKCVNLGKQKKSAYVHILVAQTFIPNPENKPTVNHINGDKTNNHVENLEWATYYEQQEHRANVMNEKGPMPIEQYDLVTGETIKIYNSQKEASNSTKINYGNISSVINGRLKQAGGYGWRKHLL